MVVAGGSKRDHSGLRGVEAPSQKERKRRRLSSSPAAAVPTRWGGLELYLAPGSITGYRCVSRSITSSTRPFEVRVSKNGRKVRACCCACPCPCSQHARPQRVPTPKAHTHAVARVHIHASSPRPSPPHTRALGPCPRPHVGTQEHLGSFETAVEAAYCFACFKNDKPHVMPPTATLPSATRQSSKLPPPIPPEEALRLAELEGLNLLRDSSTVSGFRGVSYSPADSTSRPYRVRITWRGREEFIGSYRTAEEAALRYSRRIRQLQQDGVIPPKSLAARVPLTSPTVGMTVGASSPTGGSSGKEGQRSPRDRSGGAAAGDSRSKERAEPAPARQAPPTDGRGRSVPSLEGRRSANTSTSSTATTATVSAPRTDPPASARRRRAERDASVGAAEKEQTGKEQTVREPARSARPSI